MDQVILPRYHTTLEGLRETLTMYGVAVLPSVMTPHECEVIGAQVWSDLEHISSLWRRPIDRYDTSTWKIDNFSALHGMLIQHHQIGHFQSAWDVRQHPKTVEAFSHVWGTTDLLTSFDGMSISFPPEITGKGWARKDGLWLHTDQSYVYDHPQTVAPEPFSCVQGWFTPVDVREGDATLTFLERSHLYHRHFGQRYGITDKDDWYKLTPDQVGVYVHEFGCPLAKIVCPAGSLVFWDSRTIHCGAQPDKGRTTMNMRMCIYVCLMPRAWATDAQIKKRQNAYQEKRITRHHPINITLFPKNPRIWSKESKELLEPMAEIPYPSLTDVGRRLAGF